jgi:Domain of unknown function (DUF309)
MRQRRAPVRSIVVVGMLSWLAAAGGPMQEPTARLLELGRARFNERRYFEAHEVWEEAWLAETGETKRLLQGLIQIAAGYHKAFERRQRKGCVRLLEAGLSKIVGGVFPRLALESFATAVRNGLIDVRRWERGEVDRLERARAPRLRSK